MTKSPRLHLDLLRLGCRDQIVDGDGGAVLEIIDLAVPRDVEQHAAPDHARLGLLDAVLGGAAGIDQLRVVAVPHLVVEEDMAERVPLRAALERHRDRVVGVADAAAVLPPRHRVGAGRQHGVDRIVAVAPQALLRAVAVVRQSEGENLALADEPRRGGHVLGRHVIERAELVIGSPFAPALEALRRLAQMGHVEGLGVVTSRHRRSPPDCLV